MFFEQMQQLMTPGVEVTMNLRMLANGNMAVSALPKMKGLKDEAGNLLVPFTAEGSATDLDAGFILRLTQPMQKTTGLLTNMKEFEKQTAKAEAESKEAKQRKDNEAKDEKAKREKSEGLMKKIDEAVGEGKFNNALALCLQSKRNATPEQIEKLDAKMSEIRNRQAGLFGVVSQTPATAAQPSLLPLASSDSDNEEPDESDDDDEYGEYGDDDDENGDEPEEE